MSSPDEALMTRAPTRLCLALALLTFASGCQDVPVGTMDPLGCSDFDGDGVGQAHESDERDLDGDGLADARDDDADGDGVLDQEEAGDTDCATPPMDSDGDGLADLFDLDSNGDGTPDAEADGDADGDGHIDRIDPDVDGDGLANAIEAGADTDGDATPDVRDLDSDDDTVLDRDEGGLDGDGDGTPNFRDTDADGDGTSDRVEAGDADPASPPRHCAVEIDSASGEPAPDGIPDFLDVDADGDAVTDTEEAVYGTSVCGVDGDGDDVTDLYEVAYSRVVCPAGGASPPCGCGADPDCQPPPDSIFVILPYLGPPVSVDVSTSTRVSRADLFFLIDTTASMREELRGLQRTLTDSAGFLAGVATLLPDTWIGVATFADFPFLGYGHGSAPWYDRPFVLGSRVRPPVEIAEVSTAVNAAQIGSGGDWPESGVFALHQLVTGHGGLYSADGISFEVPDHAAACESGLGAPCFRADALPVIVTITDACQHMGPASDRCGSSYAFDTIAPTAPLPDYTTLIDELRAVGARSLGLNAGTPCGPNPDEVIAGDNACHFLRSLARDTGSVVNGEPLVFDSQEIGPEVLSGLALLIAGARMDVDAVVRADPHPTLTVDPRDFVSWSGPACEGPDPAPACIVPPAGSTVSDAAEIITDSEFIGVLPGSETTFRVVLENDVFEGGGRAEVFVLYLETRADRRRRLSLRPIYVIIPPASVI